MCFRAASPFTAGIRHIKPKRENLLLGRTKKHYLTSKGGAVILWVSSPPSF